jgi:hypothetical protein
MGRPLIKSGYLLEGVGLKGWLGVIATISMNFAR